MTAIRGRSLQALLPELAASTCSYLVKSVLSSDELCEVSSCHTDLQDAQQLKMTSFTGFGHGQSSAHRASTMASLLLMNSGPTPRNLSASGMLI